MVAQGGDSGLINGILADSMETKELRCMQDTTTRIYSKLINFYIVTTYMYLYRNAYKEH